MSHTNFNTITGRNVQLLRNRLGLTQEALATYLHVSRGQVNYYEAGKRAIPTDQLKKLADLFCVNEYDLYAEDLSQVQLNLAFAFRADEISSGDLVHIARFKKIVRNYLNMKKQLCNE